MNNTFKFFTGPCISMGFSMGISIVFVIISANVRAEAKPDWVDGESKFYPDMQYLTATGSADKIEQAKNRAISNLSKIFETHISEMSISTSDTQIQLADGNEKYTKNQQLAQRIHLSTDKIIHGVRIAEMWRDEKLFTYHALAVLDRQQATNNIQDEMSRIDADTSIVLQQEKSQPDALLSIAAINTALKLQQQRYSLHKMLKIIDRQGSGSAARWNLTELKSTLETKLRDLKISIAVDNDPMSRLEQSLTAALANAGFHTLNGEANYILVASLDVQDLGFRQGWYWLRGKLRVKLVEADGTLRGSKEWQLKVSALQHADAESRLVTQVSNKLQADIKSTMLEFAIVE